MNPADWSAKGARVRAATYLLDLLERDGRRVWPEDDQLLIEPDDGLQDGDIRILRDLKPELMLLTALSPQQRASALMHYESPDLLDLRSAVDAFSTWQRLNPDERGILSIDPWGVADIAAIGRLRAASDGTIVQAGAFRLTE